MLNRIQTREILAWLTLAVAFILLGATIALGQTKTINVENDNSKVHLKISKTENGETVKIDTTFEITDDVDLDKIINQISGNDKDHFSISSQSKSNNGSSKNKGSIKKKKHIIVDLNLPDASKEDMENLHDNIEKSMKDLKNGLRDMSESLQQMNIRVDGDADSDFHFDFEIPDIHIESLNNKCQSSYSYSYSHGDNAELDSLQDDNHIIIVAGKDEKAPELEKVINSKDGKKIYVYKRSGVKDETGKKNKESKSGEKPDISNFEYYPNPTNGKFTVKFNTDEKIDLLVQVLDNNSKEIFSAKLNNFEGEYSKQIDLSDWSKGNYILKISQGNKSVSKKIILN